MAKEMEVLLAIYRRERKGNANVTTNLISITFGQSNQREIYCNIPQKLALLSDWKWVPTKEDSSEQQELWSAKT